MKNNYISQGRCLLFFTFSLILSPFFTDALNPYDVLHTHVSENVNSQESEIHGTISDVSGVPLVGAHILVKATKHAVVSDFDGSYSIKAQSNDVLIVSALGFTTQTISVNDNKEINIQLEVDITQLDAVTINAGYYTVKDKERTGNISKIKQQDIEQQPVNNVFAALQGRAAGVIVKPNTGVPGGSFSIQIRGRNSIAGGNQPLYIIDGVPYLSSALGATFSNPITGGGNPLQALNLSDIGSIEILKDADATAIYGSRGANGVVLITTKKGKQGKTRLDVTLKTGIGTVSQHLKMLNTKDYLEMRNEAFTNDGVAPNQFNAPDLELWDANRDTDWQHEVFGKTAFINDMHAAISGGSAQTNFRVGATYHKETSVFSGDFNYRKTGVHASINHHSLDDRFTINMSNSYTQDRNNQPLVDPTLIALFTPPNAPLVYHDDGTLNWENNTFSNPMALLLRHYKNNVNTLLSHAVISYKLDKNLSLKVNTGYNKVSSDQKGISPKASLNPAFYNSGEAWFGKRDNESWIIEPQVSYTTSWGKQKLQMLFGATFQENTHELEEFYANGYSNDALIENIAAASNIRVQNVVKSDYRYQAFFGRINWSHDSKYFLNATGRRDGSSRFGTNNRWANFGAVGAAWIFSREDWYSEDSWLNFGKVRASYGTTGNDQISDYGYLDSWSPNFFSYGGSSGLYPSRLFNADYGWEINKKLEAAIDLGMAHDRLVLSAAYYRNTSSNQLVGQPLPNTTGFSSIQNNLNAKVRNTGWEFELHTKNVQSGTFGWETNVLLTIPDNKLIAFPNLESSVYANTYVIGESLNIVKTYKNLGVDSQTGYYHFEDVNGDGIISAAFDKQTVKELGPKWYGSIQNSLQWKGWELSFLFDFVKQTGRNYNYSIGSPPGYLRNQPNLVLDHWLAPGDDSDIQRFSQSREANTAYRLLRDSDYSITDASFIKLRTLALSYSLPQRWAGTIGIKSGQFFIQGQNLLTITNYKGLDPETQRNNVLPPLKVLMAGVKFSL